MRSFALSFLLLAALVLEAGCDSSEDTLPPRLQVTQPEESDSLIIGAPFQLSARAGDNEQIAFARVRVGYADAEPVIDVRLDNPSRSSVFTVDTTLVLPEGTRPSNLTDRNATLRFLASDGSNREELEFIVRPVAP